MIQVRVVHKLRRAADILDMPTIVVGFTDLNEAIQLVKESLQELEEGKT